MKLEDIRLKPEEIQAICDELVSQPSVVLNDFLQKKFNTATDKTIKKIMEGIDAIAMDTLGDKTNKRYIFALGEYFIALKKLVGEK